MLGHQVKVEFVRVFTWRQCIVWAALVLVLPVIQFMLIKDGYVYYRQLDLFLRLNSNFVPLLFPIIMVLVYSISFPSEQKNHFIPYVRIRIPLTTYFLSKLIVNAILSFLIAFLIVFVPFIFSMYIEPYLGIVRFYPTNGNPIPYTTFEQLLVLGTLPYGVLYSLWVGLNGMMYATMGLLLVMILEKPFIALSIPFVYYLLGNFITQVLGYDQFSPTFTIFPFSISQQPLWTVFVPFLFLCFVVMVLMFYLKERLHKHHD
ncbi:ABC transporter permease [Geobacillus stearothermophilus]|jgi:hypothetical protein|uniref:ABC transporter permease n=2 Tax=Geobacillus TaxID=129337 RepID=A0A223EYQ0_9BACL|nr:MULTISPECIES: hypothetical protein [Geobacillus]RAN30099.1 ABC transporter permease [Geobacillus sp. A8]AMQ19829.1 ABC transporter permease [Geobacillus sp. JS12]AST00332.1 ABC transporter permease [Geobacillus thermocatenulatus]EPR30306.1 hypothetical protein I656_00026 [Geobacillus sp. WSUCF1]KDE49990.1 ABC transporter permease [Geobacillus sp. CAMR5420]